VELAKAAKQVYLSTRRGSWIINRVWDNGLPFDLVFTRFAAYYLAKLLPASLQNRLLEKSLQARFDHDLYGLKPAHRVYEGHPTVSDDLPNRIIAGSVVVKPDIERLTKTGVIFQDGSEVENIDVIVTATGYVFGFPFIDHPGFEVSENNVNLYQYVFPPEIEPPGSLAVIGCAQTIGSILATAEMQCRWAILILKGSCKLPSREEMWKEVETRRDNLAKSFYKSTRHTLQVFPVPYQIELSRQMGCHPNMLKLVFTDPKLAYHLIFGPFTPYQNRLVGPGAWPGAREAILKTMDRVHHPFMTRNSKKHNSNNETHVFSWIILFGVILLVLAVYLGIMP